MLLGKTKTATSKSYVDTGQSNFNTNFSFYQVSRKDSVRSCGVEMSLFPILAMNTHCNKQNLNHEIE